MGARSADPGIAVLGNAQLTCKLRVRVTTAPPISATYEGLLYTADPITNLIVLSIPPPPSLSVDLAANSANTFKLLPLPQLASFTVLSLPPHLHTAQAKSSNPNLPEPVPLDMATLESRIATTVAHLKAQDAKRGRGVTKEAQDIFDGIARTYPARWMGTAMVVNDMVLIESPYEVDDCRLLTAKRQENGTGNSSGSGSRSGSRNGAAEGARSEVTGGLGADPGLSRIKKVLAMEREKLRLRTSLATGGLSGVPARRGLGLSAGAGAGLGERKGG